ncbi:MAG: lipopolysaccharide biosynthesis regulator YciM [Deltaproteobacteria bacterium]|nr:lipopolysaccharide biosynthesis regulator YciM [Deltaproteobacteria bacterium]
MAVRLLFLLFVVVLIAFYYISVLNGHRIPFFYTSTLQTDMAVYHLVILSFSLGAAMVILGTMVNDVTAASKNWRERRERHRRKTARERAMKARELVQRGMLLDATKELTRSLSVNPEDREALELLASAHEEMGNPLEAVKALTQVKQIDPSDLSVYFRLAGLYRRMNDAEAALSALKTVEATEGENPRAWEGIRDIHLARGEMVPAYAEQKKLMRHRGKEATPADHALFTALRYEKAMVRLGQGKTDDAERRLRDLVKEEPSFCASYIALSDYLRSRDLNEATEILIQGFRVARNPVFLIKLEDLCIETERPQSMIRIYSRLQQEFPSDYDVNLFMGKFFLRLEMIDEGLEQLLKAESLEPERESVHVLLAEAFRRRNRFESACQHYQRAYGYKRRYLIPFRCSSCGSSTIKWTPRCPACGSWNGYAIDHGNREYSVNATPR